MQSGYGRCMNDTLRFALTRQLPAIGFATLGGLVELLALWRARHRR